MKQNLYFIAILSLFLFEACRSPGDNLSEPGFPSNVGDFLTEISASPQRSGDIELGEEFLLYGDYIKSGVPRAIFNNSLGLTTNAQNLLNRSGNNEDIYFEFTSINHPNGVEVVSPNCFQCHGGYVDDQFILGLGNTFGNFTTDQSAGSSLLDGLVSSAYGMNSSEWEAYFEFGRAVKSTGPYLVTETIGSNPADKLALVLSAFRNKDDLTWSDDPLISIPDEVIPADVPAWWLLKKKSVMFSTGIGRGDFAKMMMASSILTLTDSTEARAIDDQFVNVKEFILSLEAPVYSGSIDAEAANRGKEIFEINCSTCHGNYGDNESYTTYIVDHELIQTDIYLAQSNYAYADFENWFNTSWFGVDRHNAQIVPGDGYIAQPLDGVWATAPYLHNGSVPTLEALLNSPLRPRYWKKSISFDNYDHIKMGLKFTEQSAKTDDWTYDTTLPGYGNEGHYFGDHLKETERSDLLEYLKTL